MTEVCKSWARIFKAADIGMPILTNRSFLQKVAAQLLGHAAAAKPGIQIDVSSFHCKMFMSQYADHDLLTLAFDQLGLPREGYVACVAVVAGRAATVQWLVEEKRCTLQSTSSALAAVNGHLQVLIYLQKIKFPFHPNTSMRAARNGHLHILQILHAHGYAWHAETLVKQWLYEHECPRDAAKLKHNAAATGQVHIMQWLLLRDGLDLPASVISKAASKGRLTMCKLLLQKGCQFNAYACHLAAEDGHLSVLQYLSS
jgi:hypothetical protein